LHHIQGEEKFVHARYGQIAVEIGSGIGRQYIQIPCFFQLFTADPPVVLRFPVVPLRDDKIGELTAFVPVIEGNSTGEGKIQFTGHAFGSAASDGTAAGNLVSEPVGYPAAAFSSGPYRNFPGIVSITGYRRCIFPGLTGSDGMTGNGNLQIGDSFHHMKDEIVVSNCWHTILDFSLQDYGNVIFIIIIPKVGGNIFFQLRVNTDF
jgi:hypothetical protein